MIPNIGNAKVDFTVIVIGVIKTVRLIPSPRISGIKKGIKNNVEGKRIVTSHPAIIELRAICISIRNDNSIRGKHQALEVISRAIDRAEAKYFVNEGEIIDKKVEPYALVGDRKGKGKIQSAKSKIPKKINHCDTKIDWAKVWQDELHLPI